MSTETLVALASYGTEDGVRVEIFNESRPYGYANLFQVRLRVSARFPEHGKPYERILERLGVSDADLPRVRSEMVEDFERNALPYLLRADFPERHEAHRSRKRATVIPFPVRP